MFTHDGAEPSGEATSEHSVSFAERQLGDQQFVTDTGEPFVDSQGF
ncbi:MAG TPA: hypothetical protein VD926_15190 [Acidimicrobiales bacterium]|nr:hypothetical protein [Acidimicrobiales bacterium]